MTLRPQVYDCSTKALKFFFTVNKSESSVWPCKFVLFFGCKQSERQWCASSSCNPRDRASWITYDPSQSSSESNLQTLPTTEMLRTWRYPSFPSKSTAFPSSTAVAGLPNFLNFFSKALKPIIIVWSRDGQLTLPFTFRCCRSKKLWQEARALFSANTVSLTCTVSLYWLWSYCISIRLRSG